MRGVGSVGGVVGRLGERAGVEIEKKISELGEGEDISKSCSFLLIDILFLQLISINNI